MKSMKNLVLTVNSNRVSLPNIVMESLEANKHEPLDWLDYPYGDNYALAPDACRFLQALIRRSPGATVLEFGAGISTLVLAHSTVCGSLCATSQGAPMVVSIEASHQISRVVEGRLNEAGLSSTVKLNCLPIKLKLIAGRLLYFYSITIDKLEQLAPIDLVIVDGPPGHLGREASLYICMPYIKPGGILLLDDADRVPLEQVWLQNWKAAFGDAINIWVLKEFERYLAVVQIEDPKTCPKIMPWLFMADVRRIWSRFRRVGLRELLAPNPMKGPP